MLYEIRDLHFAYRSNAPEVLRGVNLTIRKGEILTVLGRNGAGKSTLFSCMLGMKKPCQGSIHILGRDIRSMTGREIASVAGFVPQSHNPAFSYTVEEFVLMGCAAALGLFSAPGEPARESWAGPRSFSLMSLPHIWILPIRERCCASSKNFPGTVTPWPSPRMIPIMPCCWAGIPRFWIKTVRSSGERRNPS